MDPPDRNRWTRMLDRRPSTSTAAVLFALYMGGTVLLISSVWIGLAGLLLLSGELGTGVADRLIGLLLLTAAVLGFLAGRWATGQYSVQRRA